LKCPKCGTKFLADGTPPPPTQTQKPTYPPTQTHPQTQKVKPPVKGGKDPGRASSITLPTSNAGHGDFDLPTASGSLRELFDDGSLLPDLPPADIPMSAASSADAMSLLKDDEPPPRRPRNLAEGRAKARRCPTCGSVVPQGMSLCNTCGLDLDTGGRIDLMEDLSAVPVTRSSGPPIGIWLVGLLSMAVATIFTIISLIKFSSGESAYALLLLVCLFGAYAAVRFLQSKSVKLLLIALTLGAFVDVVALVILPIIQATSKIDVHEKKVDLTSIDDENIKITNPADLLDTNQLTWGIAILASYAAVALYLNSPPVRRHFNH
jgi:hypothetical protein